MVKRFEFDVKMFANICVLAETEDEVREILRAGLRDSGGEADGVNFGCFPDGSPILGSISVDDDELPCEEYEDASESE